MFDDQLNPTPSTNSICGNFKFNTTSASSAVAGNSAEKIQYSQSTPTPMTGRANCTSS
jgi:hypothetical protein